MEAREEMPHGTAWDRLGEAFFDLFVAIALVHPIFGIALAVQSGHLSDVVHLWSTIPAAIFFWLAIYAVEPVVLPMLTMTALLLIAFIIYATRRNRIIRVATLVGTLVLSGPAVGVILNIAEAFI